MTMSMSATQTQTQIKREGDISDAFVSLSGSHRAPLPPKFLDLKRELIRGNEEKVIASWNRLLRELKIENDVVAKQGPAIVPAIDFAHLDAELPRLRDELRKRGVAVIKGVVPESEARAYKNEIEEYVKQNPSTKGE